MDYRMDNSAPSSDLVPGRQPSVWPALFVACLVIVLVCSLVPGAERFLDDPNHGWVTIHGESEADLQLFEGQLRYLPNRYVGRGGGFDAFVVLETRNRILNVDYYGDN